MVRSCAGFIGSETCLRRVVVVVSIGFAFAVFAPYGPHHHHHTTHHDQRHRPRMQPFRTPVRHLTMSMFQAANAHDVQFQFSPGVLSHQMSFDGSDAAEQPDVWFLGKVCEHLQV